MGNRTLKRLPTLCLVCGVDSGPIRSFLIVFMGGAVFASLLILLWAWGTRRISLSEREARFPLDAELGKDETK